MANVDSMMGPGLRLLLRFRVPESKLEATHRRILDVVGTHGLDAEADPEQLARLVRETMNRVAPRPQKAIARDHSSPSPEVLGALAECTGMEEEIARLRYAEGQSIEEIADVLHVEEDRVRDALSRVRRRIMPVLK